MRPESITVCIGPLDAILEGQMSALVAWRQETGIRELDLVVEKMYPWGIK